MVKKFSSASSDVENLRRALDQLKAVREELDQTIEKLALTDEVLQDTRQHLQEAVSCVIFYDSIYTGFCLHLLVHKRFWELHKSFHSCRF